MKKTLSALISICSLCLLSGCSTGSSSAPPPPPALATHFSVTAPSSPQTAGTAFSITVTALDASNSAASGYAGTVHFASSDAQAVLPGDSTLTNGTKVFSVTLKTAIGQTITVSDTAGALTPDTSSAISVNAAPTSQLLVMAPASTTVGAPFGFTVTAQDQFSNTTATYSGTVQFSSTDGSAVLPLSATLTNGTLSFSAILKTTPNQTITAMDIATHSIHGTSGSIGVTPGAATHFAILTPANTTAGSLFSLTVTALDLGNNVATGYTGMVTFTSTDPLAVLPLDSTLTNGTADFPATLKTTPSQTITVSGKARGLTAATSNPIIVSAATAENPVPLIYQPLNPGAILPDGGLAFKLTVNGTGFVSGSTVKWNGSVRATTFVSNSKLTATVLATDLAQFSTASVTVVNPPPGGGTSNVVFFETTRATSSVALSARSELAAGTAPDAVAVGDFNGDGKLDLAVANSGSSNVSILLGNGDGTFQPAVDYGTGVGAVSVAVGDFNGDGKLDLATSNASSNNVSILLGNGDGTFQPAMNYNVGSSPSSVAVGDFNGDGKLDLAVANSASSNVSVLLGNGDGTFQAALNNGTGFGSSSVAVGDFNGDGRLDLAVSNVSSGNTGPSNVSVLLGNGDGTFQPVVGYMSGTNTSFSSVAVGDFNGDDKLDLAVTSGGIGGNNNVSILLGNGDGTFQSPVEYAAGSNPYSVAVGDFNGDGRLDMAVADADSPAVSILLQPGLVSGPNAILSHTSMTFATQLLNTTSPVQSVQLSNYGTTTLNIASIDVTTNYSETHTCGSNLAAGASCFISVTFTPTALGNLNGTLSITDDAPGSPQTVSLSGLGTEVELSPASLRFVCAWLPGPNGTFYYCSGPQQVTVTNVGTTALVINAITITGLFSQTNTCVANLGTGQSCTISVDWVHSGGSGGVLSIDDNGGASPQTVPLSTFLQGRR